MDNTEAYQATSRLMGLLMDIAMSYNEDAEITAVLTSMADETEKIRSLIAAKVTGQTGEEPDASSV